MMCFVENIFELMVVWWVVGCSATSGRDGKADLRV